MAERPAGGHEDERRLLGCARSGRRAGPHGASNKGQILWQIAIPRWTAPMAGGSVNGPLAVVNGVIFAGSMDSMA